MIKIYSDRLIIRDHIPDDIDEVHSLLSDNEVMHFLPDIKTSSFDESQKNLNESLNQAKLNNNRQKYFFAITDKNNNYIGQIGYTVFSRNKNKEKNVHLGYFIKKEYWGKGITSEAVSSVSNFAFKHSNVRKI